MLIHLRHFRYVKVEQAEQVVGNPYFVRLGQEAQRASYTLLTNKNNILPLRNLVGKVYAEGFDVSYLTNRSIEVVETPEEADVALLRLRAPFEPRSGGFEALYTAGKQSKGQEAHVLHFPWMRI
jgi:hypothetical protein